MPPPRRAVHESSLPLRRTAAGTPPTVTFTDRGTNFSSTRTVWPSRATATPLLAAIGAPQRLRQHQEEIASGTCPAVVRSDAEGGAAVAETIPGG